MKSFLEEVKLILFPDKLFFWLVLTSLVANLAVWLGVFYFSRQPKEVFIGHYNIFFGVDRFLNLHQAADIQELFFIPLIGLFFLLFNLFLAIFLVYQLKGRPTIICRQGNNSSAQRQWRQDILITNQEIGLLGGKLLLMAALILQIVLSVYLIALKIVNYH